MTIHKQMPQKEAMVFRARDSLGNTVRGTNKDTLRNSHALGFEMTYSKLARQMTWCNTDLPFLILMHSQNLYEHGNLTARQIAMNIFIDRILYPH